MGDSDKLKTFVVLGCNIAALVLIVIGIGLAGKLPDGDDIKQICDAGEYASIYKDMCTFFRTWQTSESFNIISLACVVCAMVFLIVCALIRGKEYSTCCLFSRIPDAVGFVLLLLVCIMLPVTFNNISSEADFFKDADDLEFYEGRKNNLVGLWGCDFAAMIVLIASFVIPFVL